MKKKKSLEGYVGFCWRGSFNYTRGLLKNSRNLELQRKPMTEYDKKVRITIEEI